MPVSRLRRILGLALPIIAAMLSQSLLNVVDTAMVGRLGDAALAAVGLGGFALFTCQALLLGLSVGVQSVAARRKGEGRLELTAAPLNAALLVVLAVGPLSALVLAWLAPWGFAALSPDAAVVAGATPYFQIRIAAGTFMAANYAFRGYWNAVDEARWYMATLLVMHAANIFLNWVLIYGNLGAPALGVSGAGLATALSVVLGTGLYFVLGWRLARAHGFLRVRPQRSDVRTLVRISLPAGLQHLSMSAGLVALFWIVGRMGTRDLAAANVLVNVMSVALLPGMGLALAAATLVGQALGRGDADEAMRWAHDTLAVGMLLLVVLAAPLLAAPDLVLGIFLHDPDTLELARWPARVAGIAVLLEGAKRVYMHALMGAGDARRVARIGVLTQWGMFLPVAWLLGPVLGFGLLTLWLWQEVYRLLQTVLYLRDWRSRRWAGIRV